MASLKTAYLVLLNSEFDRRRSINSRYSVRAFAKFLNVDPSFLSKVLGGKLLPSLEAGVKILDHLKWALPDRRIFLRSLAEELKKQALYDIDPALNEPDSEG